MGLFALVSSGLSVYLWLVTAWDVFHPLSSTITSNAPSISRGSLLDLVRGQERDPDTPSVRKRRRSHARLENAQREEVRKSMKVLVVWLILKGLEPLFDNSLGYIVPLYGVVKVLALLIYMRFRSQLSQHLFESFVVPLGKPNTPLLDLGALNSIVFPTIRFLLSLPFAHLVVAVKNQLNPVLRNWLSHQGAEEDVPVEVVEQAGKGPPPDRVPPPPPPPSRSAAAGSVAEMRRSLGTNRGQGGSDRGQGGGGETSFLPMSTARKKASVESQAGLDNKAFPPSSHTTKAYAKLQMLPSAPRDPPVRVVSQPAPSATAIPPSTLRPYAFIPPSTLPSSTLRHPESPTDRSNSVEASVGSTPRMPGSLADQSYFYGGRSTLQPPSTSQIGIPGKQSGDEMHGSNGGAQEDRAVRQASPRATTAAMPASTNSTPHGRRKRADEGADSAPRKTRVSPSKSRARSRPQVSTTDTDAGRPGQRAASEAAVVPSSSASTRKMVTRSRRKGA